MNLTAEQARRIQPAPYPLEEILADVARAAKRGSTCVFGYLSSRITKEVLLKLDELGYSLSNDNGQFKISWEEVP